MNNVYVCDAVRTPIGRYGGALSTVRTDDLAALPLKALFERNPSFDPNRIDEVILGCANQAGEDNRNVARMATLLSGLPVEVPAVTMNRLCGSGMDAIGTAARAIMCGEIKIAVAGGVESMSRAPYVIGKSESAFGRNPELFDTTMAWRFVNPSLDNMYGTETMPQTAENVAERFGVTREQQDEFALRSQQKAVLAQEGGCFDPELIDVEVETKKSSVMVSKDESPRANTSLEALSGLKTLFLGGTVTAGNASSINDGACAALLASEDAANELGLTPLVRVVGMATAGVEPRYMGIGPVPAVKKLLNKHHLSVSEIDIFELNEAFAAQALACIHELNIPLDHPGLNPYGGAIALGHPLGMSGARLVTTATHQLVKSGGKYAVCAMCIGVGQGIAILLENVSEKSS